MERQPVWTTIVDLCFVMRDSWVIITWKNGSNSLTYKCLNFWSLAPPCGRLWSGCSWKDSQPSWAIMVLTQKFPEIWAINSAWKALCVMQSDTAVDIVDCNKSMCLHTGHTETAYLLECIHHTALLIIILHISAALLSVLETNWYPSNMAVGIPKYPREAENIHH